jgi:glucosamine--fructose-6-phosphate aminotransferase (isomerizing)
MSVASPRGFDPQAPLPGPPEPWAGSTMPEPRGGPPFWMTEMIAAEPALAERLLGRLRDDPAVNELAAALAAAAAKRAPIVVSGCGTSEHAAQAAVEIWREALRDVRDGGGGRAWLVARQAFEAALEPQEAGLFVAVSHEGGTSATNRALAAAREAGARTALVTCGRGSPGARLAGIVVATAEQDRSWCHTVGYLSPIVAALAVAGRLTDARTDAAAVRALVERGLAPAVVAAVERAAASLGRMERLVVVGSGADRVAARELALKVEEACYLPATMRDLETLLHGHLPATDGGTGLVLVLADARAVEARLARARQVLAAAAAIGLTAVGLIAEPLVGELQEALEPGLIVPVPSGPDPAPGTAGLPAAAGALLATAIPLQLLTERLARVRGTDPDTLRRTEAAYREAGERHG